MLEKKSMNIPLKIPTVTPLISSKNISKKFMENFTQIDNYNNYYSMINHDLFNNNIKCYSNANSIRCKTECDNNASCLAFTSIQPNSRDWWVDKNGGCCMKKSKDRSKIISTNLPVNLFLKINSDNSDHDSVPTSPYVSPSLSASNPTCTDNPYAYCEKQTNNYLCYSTDYNNKYKQCCKTCGNCINTASTDTCNQYLNKGDCTSNTNEVRLNAWNKCCATCRGTFTQPPALTTQPSALITQSPALITQSPVLTTQPPALTTQPPALITQSPALTTQPPALTTQPLVTPVCTDNPSAYCEKQTNNYLCYSTDYNEKYRQCCKTCGNCINTASTDTCNQYLNKGDCISNTKNVRLNAWNKCCATCRGTFTKLPISITQPPALTTQPPALITQSPALTTQPPALTTQPLVTPVLTTQSPALTT